jgi:hypothetical protein
MYILGRKPINSYQHSLIFFKIGKADDFMVDIQVALQLVNTEEDKVLVPGFHFMAH